MSLRQRIDEELRAALRAKDELRLNTLRQVKTYIKNKEVELIQSLDDTGILQILATLVKQRRESIEQFTKGGRADLVAKETQELEVLQNYLPAALSEAELVQVIRECIAVEKASGPKDMGRVMKIVMTKVAGRADGKVVSELVKRCLSA